MTIEDDWCWLMTSVNRKNWWIWVLDTDKWTDSWTESGSCYVAIATEKNYPLFNLNSQYSNCPIFALSKTPPSHSRRTHTWASPWPVPPHPPPTRTVLTPRGHKPRHLTRGHHQWQHEQPRYWSSWSRTSGRLYSTRCWHGDCHSFTKLNNRILSIFTAYLYLSMIRMAEFFFFFFMASMMKLLNW